MVAAQIVVSGFQFQNPDLLCSLLKQFPVSSGALVRLRGSSQGSGFRFLVSDSGWDLLWTLRNLRFLVSASILRYCRSSIVSGLWFSIPGSRYRFGPAPLASNCPVCGFWKSFRAISWFQSGFLLPVLDSGLDLLCSFLDS